MEIKCPDGGNGGRSNTFPATHEELSPTAMLSVVANLTPWSDHNQSPRNMYQCQVFTMFLKKHCILYLMFNILLLFVFGFVDGKTNNGFFFTSNSCTCRSKAVSSSGSFPLILCPPFSEKDLHGS